MLARALEYAQRGWHVFPLAPGTKKPIKGSNGFKDATTSASRIRDWWRESPDANVAIATGTVSGVFVVDADLYKDESCLKRLEDRYGALGATYTVMTPR